MALGPKEVQVNGLRGMLVEGVQRSSSCSTLGWNFLRRRHGTAWFLLNKDLPVSRAKVVEHHRESQRSIGAYLPGGNEAR